MYLATLVWVYCMVISWIMQSFLTDHTWSLYNYIIYIIIHTYIYIHIYIHLRWTECRASSRLSKWMYLDWWGIMKLIIAMMMISCPFTSECYDCYCKWLPLWFKDIVIVSSVEHLCEINLFVSCVFYGVWPYRKQSL